MNITTKSTSETQEVARDLAKEFINQGGVIALSGELGAGKTTFVQGFAEGLGIKDKIISPTFVLMRQHDVPDSEMTLYHIDLYRLEGEINIEEIGLTDLFTDPKAIVLIEWAEKIEKDLPANTLMIEIKKESENMRLIKQIYK